MCEGKEAIVPDGRATRLPYGAKAFDRFMRLILLRHGRAAERSEWSGPDADRPLTADGRLRTRAVVRAARALVRPVDAVWTSPFARAHATALLAGRAWRAPVEIHPWLAAGAMSAMECLEHLPGGDTVLVGHEPDLGDLLGLLMGGPSIPLRKAGIAILTGEPSAGGMTLELLLSPRALLGE